MANSYSVGKKPRQVALAEKKNLAFDTMFPGREAPLEKLENECRSLAPPGHILALHGVLAC